MACSLAALLLATGVSSAAEPWNFAILTDDTGSWPAVLSSIGLRQAPAGASSILVARPGAAASPEWLGRVERGTFLVLEGESALAEMFGFKAGKENIRGYSVLDVHDPKLPAIWEKPLEIPRFSVPSHAKVFAKERWSGAPLLAGFSKGAGGVLWLEVSPGERGYERFPYLLHALTELGVTTPFRSNRLWAFFDYSYRLRSDPEYLARRWREAGIAALHVASWHFYEADAGRDEYLRRLMAACRRNAILVYAWIELPHVSEKFWQNHPEWREKTALLQDAQLDWRKLMNLTNRDCFRAVLNGLSGLIERFDWDGVNLAELYFESLEGAANPSRFTPMNEDVQAEFRAVSGKDARIEFGSAEFLRFRAELARRMQEEWLGAAEGWRRQKTDLDIVLTHVDDRLDSSIRDAIGADSSRVLPLLQKHDFTFLIEDPATVWNQGPQRYPDLAGRYTAIAPRPERLAIDINIIERYQDVYPTKQQLGTELFQLVHLAAGAFPRVALYFENSLRRADLELLPAAAAALSRTERLGGKLTIESPRGGGTPWTGPALVDGAVWPVQDSKCVWLPAGAHSVAVGKEEVDLRVLDFNGELQSARALRDAVEVSYSSSGRALVRVNRNVRSIEIDGATAKVVLQEGTLVLPRGQHLVTIRGE